MWNRLVLAGIALVVSALAALFGYVSAVDLVQNAAPQRHGSSAVGVPVDWELNFHWPDSPYQQQVYGFHNLLLCIDIAICAFVAILLLYSVWRFRQSRHPVPQRTTHNTALEVAWTVVPVVILIIIAIPSFRLLVDYNKVPKPETTLKVTGHQWYWEYQYPDNGNIDLTSVIIPDKQLKPDQQQDRLFLVDNYAVLPVHTVIRIDVTGADVIHSFFVPSLGLQKYAIPGRLNEIWTRIDREGVYYGECNQICGINHAFMPIAIRAVSKERFAAWVEQQKQQGQPQQQKTSRLSPDEERRPLRLAGAGRTGE